MLEIKAKYVTPFNDVPWNDKDTWFCPPLRILSCHCPQLLAGGWRTSWEMLIDQNTWWLSVVLLDVSLDYLLRTHILYYRNPNQHTTLVEWQMFFTLLNKSKLIQETAEKS